MLLFYYPLYPFGPCKRKREKALAKDLSGRIIVLKRKRGFFWNPFFRSCFETKLLVFWFPQKPLCVLLCSPHIPVLQKKERKKDVLCSGDKLCPLSERKRGEALCFLFPPFSDAVCFRRTPCFPSVASKGGGILFNTTLVSVSCPCLSQLQTHSRSSSVPLGRN